MEVQQEKTQINYIKGDATQPQGDGEKIIVHGCNNIGAWGAGFVMALSKRWKEPEAAYRAQQNYNLGDYELVRVEKDIHICNLISQEGTKSRVSQGGVPPVRYAAIEHGLKRLARSLAVVNSELHTPVSVHMPMIGAGLAGGNWKIIERIIEVTLCDAGIPVTVYQFD